jgi:aspartate-semialdehyde dehydrogenase
METVQQPVPGAPAAWDNLRALWRVQVFGASGAVGRELVQALLSAGHPASRLALYGRRSRELTWRTERLVIEALPANPPQAELAFLCTPPALSRELAGALAGRGTRVVDLSGSLRDRPEVALVVDGVNGQELGAFTDVIALPGRSAALIAEPLSLLDRTVGLAEVDLCCLLSAASGGAQAILALREEFSGLGARGGSPAPSGARRAANLSPALETSGDREPGDEIREDLCRLLRRPDLLLDVTALESDLERCDVFVVKALLHGDLGPEGAAQILARSPAIQVEWDGQGPVAARCTGSERVHVGRFRAGSRGARSLCFLAAGDQIRAGAARAALRVAARLPAGG